jgi:arylsulfatase A-like enzyme
MAEKKPNILMIFADQLRYDSVGFNGNRVVHTPNLDRLSREGVVFDNAFSSCPICSPYRAQILTGNFSHTNGVVCNEYRLFDNQRTLPQYLKREGYRSAYIGKWHLGYPPYTENRRYGFDDMYAYNCIHSYYDVQYWHNEDGPHPVVDFAPNVETELAIDYLKRNAEGLEGGPTCVVLSWGPPHWNALGIDRRYGDYPQEHCRYQPENMELSDNVPIQYRDFARREMTDYYGMVSSLDACMGRILDYLDSSGLADNTIVCFSSDHGDHLSSHGYGTPGDQWMHHSLRGSKATPYDEACHIPLLLRHPGKIPPNRRSRAFANSTDVLPTLLELAGAAKAEDIQGLSLAGAALGTEPSPQDSAFLQILGTGWPVRDLWLGLWRGVRTEEYMYARWKFPEEHTLLVDLRNDPGEMVNLAGNSGYAEAEKEMEARLLSWLDRTGDTFDTAERLPVTGMIDFGQAFISRSWIDKAPRAYAEAIGKNHEKFQTGELAGERSFGTPNQYAANWKNPDQ